MNEEEIVFKLAEEKSKFLMQNDKNGTKQTS